MGGMSELAEDAIVKVVIDILFYVLTDKTDYALTWTKQVRSHGCFNMMMIDEC